jgi:ABC-type branched-subunit amino acid transport system substrate-binding protein
MTTPEADSNDPAPSSVRHAAINLYARPSIISVAFTTAMITVNHLYTLGGRAFILGAALLVLSTALLAWFTRTRSRIALAGYLLLNLWIVIGFGLFKGFWEGALRLFVGTLLASLSTSFPKPMVGALGLEMSGLLMFIGGLFVLYHGYKLLRADLAARIGVHPAATPRERALLAGAATVATMALVTAYAVTARDRWVPPADGIIKIGVIVPTSGPYSLLGNSFVKAVEMAKDDLKGTKYQYQLVIRDSGPDPAKARAVIQRLVEGDRVDALIGGISIIGQVTKPFATRARIPHTCVCTVSSIGDGAYNFTNIPSPEAEGRRWVEEARKRGIHRIAVLSQDYPSINNHVAAMKLEAARAGLVIVYEQRFGGSVTDFRGMIAEAQASHPDVKYIEALPPGLDLLAHQLADAKVSNISSVVAPSLSDQPDLFEGAWYTDSNLLDPAFKKRFEDRYPGTRFATHMMPYAYDSLNMIVQAFERGRNPAVYLRELTAYDGTADRLTKQPGSGNFESRPAVWVMKEGRPQLMN